MATLAEMRADLEATASKVKNTNSSYGDGSVYPHWNIPEGQTVKLRFLPDLDPTNKFFWIEKQMIKLSFAGIKGKVDSKPTTVQVPCIEMFKGFEGKCPILKTVREWYKEDSGVEKEFANKYWKKKSYIFSGFVHDNPLTDPVPENPIRRFIISPQIFNIVKAGLMDSELEELPTDYKKGLDFIIHKFTKGNYADYSTSKYVRKESALTEEEVSAIAQYGLLDLKTFLPKMPTDDEQKIMVEMFNASVDGEAYDEDRWGDYFKPVGFQTIDEAVNGNKKEVPTVPVVQAVTSEAELALRKIKNDQVMEAINKAKTAIVRKQVA